jgi:hypothetical protein
MSEPKFIPVDLAVLQDEGILMAANEAFFWPLGLALTWRRNYETGVVSNLHIREWQHEDGHHEAITIEDDDVARERRRRFGDWVAQRVLTMPEDERQPAVDAALDHYTATKP